MALVLVRLPAQNLSVDGYENSIQVEQAEDGRWMASLREAGDYLFVAETREEAFAKAEDFLKRLMDAGREVTQ